MKVFAKHKRIKDREEHWCVAFEYEGHTVSVAGNELVIFDPDNNELKEWDGETFRLYGIEGSELKRAMDFIDYSLRSEG